MIIGTFNRALKTQKQADEVHIFCILLSVKYGVDKYSCLTFPQKCKAEPNQSQPV